MPTESHSLLFYLGHWFVSAIALLVTSYFIPGFSVQDFGSALWAAVFIGIANVVIWPVLILLTLPINILTLGLFTFVVNGAVLKMAAALLSGFNISSWTAAILGSIVLSIVSLILHFFFV